MHTSSTTLLRRGAVIAVCLALGAGAPALAQAQTALSTGVHVDIHAYTDYGGNVFDGADQSGTSAASVLKAAEADTWGGVIHADTRASATATAAPGLLGVSAASTGHGKSGPGAYLGGSQSNNHASAWAAFSDTAVLDVGGLDAGTTVRADFAIRVSGAPFTAISGTSLGGSGYESFQWGAAVAGVSYSSGEVKESFVNGVVTPAPAQPALVVLHDVALVVGQSFGIAMNAGAAVDALTGSYCGYCAAVDEHWLDATADFSHALAWNGLLGLRTADGQPLALSLASISSASGFDYTAAAVPEPASGWMFAAGAALLAGSLRRRARPRRAAAG